MIDGYFDNTLDLLQMITKRTLVITEELTRFERCDCEKAPEVPCCLLRTELDILRRYKDVLERELYHETHSSNLEQKVNGTPEWVERLQTEWSDLCIRMEKLDNFRDRFRNGDIDFVPKWDERLLCDQLRAMRTYRDCLLQYAKLEGVELDMTLYNDDYRYDYYFSKKDNSGDI